MAEDRILTALEAIGKDLVKEMRAKIKLNGSYASGWLYNSFKSKAMKRAGKYELEIDYVYYGLFVDKGRRPGKQPPLDDIRQWCRLKGIPEDAAYPIARKIGERGYAAKPFSDVAVDDLATVAKIISEMGEAFASDYASIFERDIQYWNKNKKSK